MDPALPNTFVNKVDRMDALNRSNPLLLPTQKTAPGVLALGLVLGISLTAWTWGRAASMSADGAHYMELAAASWSSDVAAGMDWYSGPGYPVVVGWIYGMIQTVSGSQTSRSFDAAQIEFAGRLVSFLFSLVTLIGLWCLARELFSQLVATVSVALLAVHTTFIRHAAMAETDTAYGCWLVWACFLTLKLKKSSTVPRSFAWSVPVALTLGLAYLTRPEAVPLAGLLAVWYLKPSRSETVKWHWRCLITALVVLMFFMVAAPYLLQLREELGRWSLSGKERSIVLKFVPDKRNWEEVLKLGISGAILERPSNIVHWLPYHLYWGVPQLVKALHPVMLPLSVIGIFFARSTPRKGYGRGFLLWSSVPFIIFFFLTFPGRRYFMQSMPAWSILAGVGTVELAAWLRRVRMRTSSMPWSDARNAGRRAYALTLIVPIVVFACTTTLSNWEPIEYSLRSEKELGQKIRTIAGPGSRVLTFTVTSFYAEANRVPLWGPMEGIVRCHGYGEPLTYDALVDYARDKKINYIVMDADLQKDCPSFFERCDPRDFELVIDDVYEKDEPLLVYQFKRDADRLMVPVAN